MRNYLSINAFILFLSLSVVSCTGSSTEQKSEQGKTEISDKEIVGSTALTAEQQAKLTPDDVLNILKEGNKDFIEEKLTVRNNMERIQATVSGQYPMAVVLSCLDSRVPVEDVFHKGLGDLFVARVAGNFVNEDILGSLEYACKVSGAKLIVVLGHEYCGAIKSAIGDVKMGNITAMLSKIQPAVASAAKNFEGEKTAANSKFVEAVCSHNVELALNDIRTKSPILKEMEEKGEIKIIGGIYHLKSGKVDFFAQ